jgi:hypothetical protein
MLNQFRSLYPQGGLISELITINHGKYIVRVLIIVDGVNVASGLAAADTVELAEDQARSRALATLDLSIESVNKIPNVQAKNVTKSSNNYIRSKKQDATNSVKTNGLSSVSNPLPSLENTFLDSPILDSTSVELPSQIEEKKEQNPLSPQPELFSSPDLSEAIAKTDIHIKRLGWSREQGRDYLLQTYGKRSRQLLSDQELWEFLHYLEKQP